MVIFRRSVVQNENFFINLIDPKDSQRFIKLKDTLHVQIKQIHSLRKRGKDACKRQKIEQKKEGLYNTVYKCDIYARYWEGQPKPRPIHIKC